MAKIKGHSSRGHGTTEAGAHLGMERTVRGAGWGSCDPRGQGLDKDPAG